MGVVVNSGSGSIPKEVEADLEREWPNSQGKASLSWTNARPATRDTFKHVQRSYPLLAKPPSIDALEVNASRAFSLVAVTIFDIAIILCPIQYVRGEKFSTMRIVR